jgi:NDP-sugar pyrophosphorylase family protein
MSKPTVVILAGGSNSRFFPLNTEVHKGALKLLGEHFIIRTLKNLAKHDFKDVIIVQSARDAESNSLQTVVEAAQLDLNLTFATQEVAKGMGDGVLTVKEELDDQFAVIFPDLYNAGELITQMVAQDSDCCVCTTHTDEPWLYGILEMDGNRVLSVEEKPEKGMEKSNNKLLGCYLLNRRFIEILEQLPEAEYNFEEALDQVMQEQNVQAVALDASIPSLKFPWHLFNFQEILFSQLESFTDQTAHVAPTALIDDSKGPVILEAGARVGDFAKIVGPCYIGKNCLVGDYSFVRDSSLEENSVVGAKTEVVRSIILDNATIHFGYLADSIIGPNSKIGAGLITANKRLDRKTIATMVKGVKTDTGLKALGIITGEGANLGISTNTMPGVLIGAGAQIHPGLVVSKNVEHSSTLQKS